jgi:hypothetical protein
MTRSIDEPSRFRYTPCRAAAIGTHRTTPVSVTVPVSGTLVVVVATRWPTRYDITTELNLALRGVPLLELQQLLSHRNPATRRLEDPCIPSFFSIHTNFANPTTQQDCSAVS